MSKERSELALAALATVALPGLDVVGTRPTEHPGSDCDVAQISDSDGNHWIIRAPRNDLAGASLAAERGLLSSLARLRDTGELDFNVPRPAGFAALPDGGEAMIYPRIAGRSLPVNSLGSHLNLARDVAQAIASLHNLSPMVFERAGLAHYSASDFRARCRAELEDAARTGHVPTPLLRRWREALDRDDLWEFTSVPIHGDLAEEHVLIRGGVVTGIVDWSSAHVSDPAEDLSWLLAAAPEQALETVIEAYSEARSDELDDHLIDRAVLGSELELVRWLMHGVRIRSNDVMDDAIIMLAELSDAVADDPGIGIHPPADAVTENLHLDEMRSRFPDSYPVKDLEDEDRQRRDSTAGDIEAGSPDESARSPRDHAGRSQRTLSGAIRLDGSVRAPRYGDHLVTEPLDLEAYGLVDTRTDDELPPDREADVLTHRIPVEAMVPVSEDEPDLDAPARSDSQSTTPSSPN